MTKNQANIFVFLLCLSLFLRHVYFYDPVIVMPNEFGFGQPLLSVALIPVTGALGVAVYFRRNSEVVIGRTTLLLLIGGLTAAFLYTILANESILKYLTYDIYDHSRRPRFLILLPIILFVSLANTKNHMIHIITLPMYVLTGNFILHYVYLFIIVKWLLYNSNEKFTNLFIFAYFLVVFIIIALELTRVNIFVEVVMVIGFLSFIGKISVYLSKYINFAIPSLSMLIFYYLQAIGFNLVNWVPIGESYLRLMILFASCIVVCLCIKRVISRYKDKRIS